MLDLPKNRRHMNDKHRFSLAYFIYSNNMYFINLYSLHTHIYIIYIYIYIYIYVVYQHNKNSARQN